MGPHHPSMHGVLRLIVTLDGEEVVDCESILATTFTEAIIVNGPEQLGNIQVPKRAISEELVYDLFEATTDMRMMHNRIGGVVVGLPYERVKGIGVIGGEEAINWGLSGPMLLAYRIKWDLRKVDHYEKGK
ncbi:hypothetical protein Goklo_004981 [Gossypium klotzschianum]|uniref:NADH-quinone oxidoreductase subunit D domain-containing protein n=2 Tax=Gossypium klotzschianum TaxID=34286 RepID=A0A7J8VRJ7_9ROSI|nr:hypothetical protein [Gossypium klotzschianum]